MECDGLPRRRIGPGDALARRAVLLVAIGACLGCQSLGHRRPQLVAPPPLESCRAAKTMELVSYRTSASPELLLARASESLEQAEAAEADDSVDCVGLYTQAALFALRAANGDGDAPAAAVQRAGLLGLLRSAQHFGCYDPLNGISVRDGSGQTRTIPIAFHGFAWSPSDFCDLRAADDYQDHDLRHHYFAPGWGAALVAVRHAGGESAFFRPDHPIAATAVLSETNSDCGLCLNVYNPQTCDRVALGGELVPLERDLSAPLGYIAQVEDRPWLTGFVEPSSSAVAPKLLMQEPACRGKIPLIFVHGLLSDPMAWADLVNELRADPEIDRRYQIWAFRYPTGDAVAASAARLREFLVFARDTVDPKRDDPALDQMILVGHSMGGLVAKLQITESYDLLWRRFATRPIDDVRARPEMRERLERTFFFSPSPSVTRVVFIGTPHRGSAWSRRAIGRVSSQVVRIDEGRNQMFADFVADNEGLVRPQFRGGLPTSLDLLEPDSPFLDALLEMPVPRRVHLHSIIGDARGGVVHERSDGVVPVSSAQLAGVDSELFVPAEHTHLHRDPATVDEVKRILREHAAGWDKVELPPESLSEAPMSAP